MYSVHSDYSVYSVFYSVYSVLYAAHSVLVFVYGVLFNEYSVLLLILLCAYSVLSTRLVHKSAFTPAHGGFYGRLLLFDYT